MATEAVQPPGPGLTARPLQPTHPHRWRQSRRAPQSARVSNGRPPCRPPAAAPTLGHSGTSKMLTLSLPKSEVGAAERALAAAPTSPPAQWLAVANPLCDRRRAVYLPKPGGSARYYSNSCGVSVTTRLKDLPKGSKTSPSVRISPSAPRPPTTLPPEPGGLACCYWNKCASSATTRLKDSHEPPVRQHTPSRAGPERQ